MERKPVVSGMFYEENKENLIKQIKQCFLSDFGPKELPKKEKSNQIFGVIAPHAGFAYSGPCQAFAYKELAKSNKPDVFIILGTDHSGEGTCISVDDWITPLGTIKNNKTLSKELIKQDIPISKTNHSQEHSIEVQIPFLQYITNSTTIVPITISQDIEAIDLAKKIQKAIDTTKQKVIFIASSDFTHYGYNYNFLPFEDDIRKNIERIDKKAIDFIKRLDSKSLTDYIKQGKATICGYSPITVLIELAKLNNIKNIELLKYYTSSDITNDNSSSVSYASILFH